MQSTQDNDALVRVPRQDFVGRVFKLTELVEREEAWLRSMESAIIYAEAFADAGYHKQVQNRLLAPYLHNRVLITGVNWQNFMDLRVHKDAEPHINILAKKILEEMNRVKAYNEIRFLKRDEWHTPYVSRLEQKAHGIEDAKKVSVARNARVSYNLADGRKTSFVEDLDLYERLAGNVPVHASPLEHVLSPDFVKTYDQATDQITWEHPELHGNTPGYKQFRKMIPGETSPEQWQISLLTKLNIQKFKDEKVDLVEHVEYHINNGELL
jgi:hypothetical protein